MTMLTSQSVVCALGDGSVAEVKDCMKPPLSLGKRGFLRVEITYYFGISMWVSKISVGKKSNKIQRTAINLSGLPWRWHLDCSSDGVNIICSSSLLQIFMSTSFWLTCACRIKVWTYLVFTSGFIRMVYLREKEIQQPQNQQHAGIEYLFCSHLL